MADILLKHIQMHFVFNKNMSNTVLLKYVPYDSVDNKSALVQVKAWCLKEDKPLPETVLTKMSDARYSITTMC